MLLENFNIKDRKYEWIYLLFSFSIYAVAHIKLMDVSNAYAFISAFFFLSIISMLCKVKPNIISTGALSSCVVLCWLFYYRGYDTKELHEIAVPYLLCASGVIAGMVITATRSYEIKFSPFREVLESAFFTIAIGFWPIYPRLFTLLHQIN